MTPLPTVDMACGMIQQKEMQREVLNQGNQVQYKVSALYSRGKQEKCGVCGNKGHSKEKCEVIGYTSWHPRSKKLPQKKLSKPVKNYKGKENYSRAVAATQSQNDNSPREVNAGLIPQQIEQLFNLIPQQHPPQHSLS